MDRKTEIIGICATGVLLFFLCLCILDFLCCILFIVGLSISNTKIRDIITLASLGTLIGVSFCLCCVISVSMIAGLHEENRLSSKFSTASKKKPSRSETATEKP